MIGRHTPNLEPASTGRAHHLARDTAEPRHPVEHPRLDLILRHLHETPRHRETSEILEHQTRFERHTRIELPKPLVARHESAVDIPHGETSCVASEHGRQRRPQPICMLACLPETPARRGTPRAPQRQDPEAGATRGTCPDDPTLAHAAVVWSQGDNSPA